jgi:hypothetical protein
MTNFPHMMAFVLTTPKENHMFDFDDMNRILNELAEQGIVEPMVEPIDDPSVEVNFWDWAEVVGAVDDFVPEEYTNV